MFKPHDSIQGEVSLHEEATTGFTIVVFFDSTEALNSAESTCEFVEKKMGRGVPIEKAFFNARYLKEETLELAAREAATADMVVVACSKMSTPTEALVEWIDLWVNDRSNEGGIIVALLHEAAQEEEELAMFSYLQEKAAAAGMDFLCRRILSSQDS